MKSLLEIALKSPVKKDGKIYYSPQHYDLALAWVTGKVTLSQASSALNRKITTIHALLCSALANGIRKGYLKIEKNVEFPEKETNK